MRADQIEWMKRKWNEVMECVDLDLVKHQETCLSLNRNYVILMLWFLLMWLMHLCDYEPNEWMCDYSMLLWTFMW